MGCGHGWSRARRQTGVAQPMGEEGRKGLSLLVRGEGVVLPDISLCPNPPSLRDGIGLFIRFPRVAAPS